MSTRMEYRSKPQIVKRMTGMLLLALLFINCSTKSKESSEKLDAEPEMEIIPASAMNTSVYTAAHKTDLKLSETGALTFTYFKQLLETEIDILVNPSKQFQTIMMSEG